MSKRPAEADRQAAALAINSSADARSRAFRTLLQVVSVEAVVVLVPLVLSFLDSGLAWSDLWRSGVRAVLASVLAWAMRKRLPPAPAAARGPLPDTGGGTPGAPEKLS